MSATWEIRQGDALERLREMPDESVQCCVTSPPYFGLRDYQTGDWEGGDEGCDHTAAPGRTVGNAPSAKSTLTTNNGRGPQPGDKFHADQRLKVADACPCGARRVDRQIGLEATPSCRRHGMFRLRSDLTEDQRRYVVQRLSGEETRDV